MSRKSEKVALKVIDKADKTSATGGTQTSGGGNDIWTFTASGTWTPVVPSASIAATFTGLFGWF